MLPSTFYFCQNMWLSQCKHNLSVASTLRNSPLLFKRQHPDDKWQLELLFDLVIVTVSQFNTKLVALELIGNRDLFPQSMPVPNTGQTQHPCPNRDSNPGPFALQLSTYPLHHGGRHEQHSIQYDTYTNNKTILFQNGFKFKERKTFIGDKDLYFKYAVQNRKAT